MKNLIKNFTIFFAVFLVIALIFSSISANQKDITEVGMQSLINQLNNEEISEIEVVGDQLNITLKNGEKELLQKETGESLSSLLSNLQIAQEKIALVNISVKDESGFNFWLTAILPFLIPFLLI